MRHFFWAILIIQAIHWCPIQGLADLSLIVLSDIEYSDPFEVEAGIMQIDYSSNMLIIAESKVYVVDLRIGVQQRIKTALSDADGKPIRFESLERGHTIMVRGMQLPDGRVIAGEIIRLSLGTGD